MALPPPTHDPSISLLIDRAQGLLTENQKAIWVIDENADRHDLIQLQHTLVPCPKLFSNRYDLYQDANELDLNLEFNDFDFSSIADRSLDYAFYRISKEKTVSHHIINCIYSKLKTSGILVLAGEKSEGIKSYIENAKKKLGLEGKSNKQGKTYFAELKLTHNAMPPSSWLDDKQYTELRQIDSIGEKPLFSKPGCYGWNKIDAGSELLINTLVQDVTNTQQKLEHVLDLGCGYGYLSLSLAHAGIGAYFSASDNNAAAILSCRHNFLQHNITGEVIADNAAATIAQQFDLIVCNPPFHKGFSTSQCLTDTFLHAAKKRLSSNGKAYFVTNRFIAIEKKAASLFSDCETLVETNQFKVMRLSQ